MSTPETKTAPDADATNQVSLYEKRKKIQVKRIRGFFDNYRILLVIITQLIFYGAPWLQWNDRQAILFHLVERKFYLFGLVLWPQDVFYLAILLIISAYALFLVTAMAGRLFCGYACPQTVYTELFIWIEHWTEGDRAARMKLDKSPWNGEKIRRRLGKHALWLILSLWTGFTLVCYFTPVSELLVEAKTFDFGGWETFWIFFYGGFTYLMAGFMREQVCKYMCPYARFQSVMFDPDTLIITYDEGRGEPRGSRRKDSDANKLGDCVDCGICVQVCPTGIDIRHGLQYECIGCAACVDACDQVMEKVGKPKGLVRYSTENAMNQHLTRQQMLSHVMRPRIILYTVILIIIVAATAWSIANRTPFKLDVIRDRSVLAREADDGNIENIYTLQFMNTDEKPHTYQLTVSGLPGVFIATEKTVEVASTSLKAVTLAVRTPPDAAPKGAHPIHLDVVATDNDKIRVNEKASFMMP